MRLKRLFQRYNPRRKFIDCDEEFIILMSQLGYAELYRGEWFLTDEGHEVVREGIKIVKENDANVCS